MGSLRFTVADHRPASGLLSRARFKSSTLTRGGAPRIAPDRLVSRSIKSRTCLDRQAPRRGDPGSLKEGGLRADVRVEARARGRHQVDRNRVFRRRPERQDAVRDRLAQVGIVRPQVRAAGRVRLVVGGRGPRMEITVRLESLGDQLRADDGPSVGP